jgi:undecaprenyl-diphosphatase
VETSILMWLHESADPALDVAFRVSHELGTGMFCLALVAVAVVVALVRRRRDEAVLWTVLGISTWCLQAGLKLVVARPRPDLWEGPIALTSYAFPSGHALAAATFFPLIARAVALRRPELARPAYVLAAVVAFYVGVGRMYLGLHWPTDVIAGWCIGALQTYLAVGYLERRRARVLAAVTSSS